jgi:hypothetical protein
MEESKEFALICLPKEKKCHFFACCHVEKLIDFQECCHFVWAWNRTLDGLFVSGLL